MLRLRKRTLRETGLRIGKWRFHNSLANARRFTFLRSVRSKTELNFHVDTELR